MRNIIGNILASAIMVVVSFLGVSFVLSWGLWRWQWATESTAGCIVFGLLAIYWCVPPYYNTPTEKEGSAHD